MSYKILHVKASPRGEQSSSSEIATAFLRRASEVETNLEVDELDLWMTALPQFGPDAVEGRYRLFAGMAVTVAQERAWQAVIDHLERLQSADLLLISSPMWNFSVPYVLKQYIDLIVQPRHTFSFEPETGYTGLISGKPAVLALSRAGEYPEEPGTPDHQSTYLELVLGFVGFGPVRKVVLEPSYTGDETADVDRLLIATGTAAQLANEIVSDRKSVTSGRAAFNRHG